MEVVVQRIRTWWTKRSRGGAEAARRNAAPTAFRLPMMPPPFVHDVVMREEDDFEPRFTTHEDLAGADLLLREENELLRVKLLVRPHSVPPRRRRPPARRLARGEWLRWQVNYRFSGYSLDWTYRLDTLNVGYGPAREDLFLGDPTHHVDERGTLR